MKMLDLCCGAGLAAAGYWLSGCFTEIVGIDTRNMSSCYPFDFIQGDAFKLDYEFLSQFDFIHASPPCQAYSKATPEHARSRHPRLIPNAHRMLKAWGGPHVIENVEGSGAELRPTIRLSGLDVGLPMIRYRLFHVYEQQPRCSFSDEKSAWCSFSDEHQAGYSFDEIRSSYSFMSTDRTINPHDTDRYVSRSELVQAFGLDEISPHHLNNLSCEDIKQGIPPRMTKAIVEKMFPKVMLGAA